MSELKKPCPFCGSKDIDSAMAKGSDGRVAAGCWKCGAVGPDKETEEKAVKAWNGRVNE